MEQKYTKSGYVSHYYKKNAKKMTKHIFPQHYLII